MHGCTTIHSLKRNPVEFIDKFFIVENFITTHARFGLLPINGQDMWLEASGARVASTIYSATRKAKKIENERSR